MLIGALEDSLDCQTWRSPTREQVAYFRQLQAWNYALSDVELLVITPADTDGDNEVDKAEGSVDSTCQATEDTTAPAADPVTTMDEHDLVA